MLLIIGCGNLILGDEGIGVHLIEELKKRNLPPNVELLDGGTGGLELIPYIKEADRVLLIDAVKGGGEPGSIYKFTPADYEEEDSKISSYSLHDISLRDVFAAMKQLKVEREIIIFGVEPECIEVKIGLSKTLSATLDRLCELVLDEARSRPKAV